MAQHVHDVSKSGVSCLESESSIVSWAMCSFFLLRVLVKATNRPVGAGTLGVRASQMAQQVCDVSKFAAWLRLDSESVILGFVPSFSSPLHYERLGQGYEQACRISKALEGRQVRWRSKSGM
jgi:hypothetical protein